MTDWIDQKISKIKAPKEEAAKQLALGRETVDQLERIVRRDVEKWNANMPQKIEDVLKTLPSGGFKIRKTSFPPAMADVFLAPDASFIQTEITKRRGDGGGTLTVSNQFPLQQSPNGSIRVTTQIGGPISLDGISRLLIESTVESG
jgi:hypothetical protein